MKETPWPVVVLRTLIFCLCCAAALALSSGLTKDLPGPNAKLLSVTLAVSGSLLLTVLFVKWERLSLTAIGIIPTTYSIRRFLAGFTAGLLMVGLQPIVLLTTGHAALNRIHSHAINTVSVNLLLYVLIACREEVAFRGYPLRVLNYRFGPWVAQSIIFCVFVLEHVAGGMTWMQALIGSGTGAVLFGLAALKTKGLALPVGLHASWNFGQWMLGFKDSTGLYKIVVDKGFEDKIDKLAWISYFLTMWSTILIIYLWKRKKKGCQ